MDLRLPFSEQFVRTATPAGLGRAIQAHVATVPPGDLDSLTVVPSPRIAPAKPEVADAAK